VRNRWRVWLGWGGNGEGEAEDGIQTLPDNSTPNPVQELLRRDTAAALEQAMHSLPLRQQQAFLLRAWEGLDVRETAFAMGCSEGSVKTHYSRAVHALRNLLEEFRP
jgi:RNA polymerase sigma-70 factor (ECF subfamily)